MADPRLPLAVARLLKATTEPPLVSAATIFEIAIKFRLDRRADPMPISGAMAILEFEASGFELLAINPEHAAAVDLMPLHHGDPFDRLLVAQSQCEGLQLLTQDSKLAAYGNHVIVV